MARYDVAWVEPVRRVENRDAYGVGLAVKRDGEHLGLWVPMVSGISLAIDGGEHGDDFWAALAVAGAEGVKQQMIEAPPEGWRLEAWLIPIDPSAVNGRLAMRDPLPDAPSDIPILSFNVG